MDKKHLTIKAELDGGQPETVKRPKVSGIAYTGGKIDVGWGLPVVIDLSKLKIPEEVPLLADHENKTGSRIGVITVEVNGSEVSVAGEILSDTEEAKNIVAQGKQKSWQMSVGVDPDSPEAVAAVEVGAMEVNGMTHEAPFFYVGDSTLREVSVVSVGADASSRMTIQAKANIQATQTNNGGKNMDGEEDKNKDGVKAQDGGGGGGETDVKKLLEEERQRIEEIAKMIDGEDEELEKEAIKAGWSPDQVAGKMLARIRAGRPQVGIITKKTDVSASKVIEAAFSIRAGIKPDDLIKPLGEAAVEAGYKDRNLSIKEAMTECIRARGGHTGRSFGNDTIRAAFATDLPGILSNVANKRLAKSFNAVDPVAPKICSEADLNDFKPSDIFNISDVGDLKEVGDDAKLAESDLTEGSGRNQLGTFGKIIWLTRKQIINDDLGAFLRMFEILGTRCAKHLDKQVFTKLLANPNFTDGKPLFGADHKNLMTGAASALSIESAKLAVANFVKQIGLDGEAIGAMPKFMVVPPELMFLARDICLSDNVVTGSSKIVAQKNSMAGLLEPVTAAHLSNQALPGNSADAWYLVGDPNEVGGLEIGYLKGQKTPTIEEGLPNFDTLAVGFRCFWDTGVGLADYRGWQLNDPNRV